MPWPNDSSPLFGGQSGVPLKTQHLTEHQNIRTAIAGLLTYLGLPPNIGGSSLLSRLGTTPSIGPIFWLGASYEDNWPNFYAVQSTSPPATFSGSWAANLCSLFGQGSGLAAFRWTPAGSVAGNLGKIYAVAGASWIGYLTGIDTTIATQSSKLIADYGGTLPAGSVVVIHCGINELQQGGILTGGGLFSDDGTTASWTQSGFTMPAGPAGTVSVPVTSSAHCVVTGTSNQVIVNNTYLMTVSAIPDGTHIQLTNTFSYGTGTVVGAGTMQPYIASLVGLSISAASTAIANLITAGVSQIIFVICPNLAQLPNFAGGATLATNTWNYWKSQAKASLYPNTAKRVSVFDMSTVTNSIITNPTAYGLKDAVTGWNNSATINQNDLMFWDGFHQNAPPHVEIASQFLATIKRRGYLSLP